MILVYVMCGLASSLASRSVDPIISVIARDLAISIDSAALISSLYALPFACSQPILGPIGDFYGKAPVLKWCLWLLTAALIASALAPNFPALLATRFVGGAVAGGVVPVAMAIISDAYPPKTRQLAIGRFVTASLMGTVLGASLAGFMAVNIGWRSFLMFAAVVAFVAAGASTFFVRSVRTDRPSGSHIKIADALGGYKKVFGNPKSILCFGTVFVEGVFFYGFTPYIGSLLLQSHRGGALEAGFILGGFGLGGILYSIFLPRILRLLRRSEMMMVGGVCYGGGLVGLALALPWPAIAAVFMISGFGFMMLHNSIQTEVSELAPSARASAFSMHSFSFFIGQGLGPLVMGAALATLGWVALIASAAVLAATGFVVPHLLKNFPTNSGSLWR